MVCLYKNNKVYMQGLVELYILDKFGRKIRKIFVNISIALN